ncbi:MAG: cytochrome c [Chthoniobacterales bacterium]
MSIITQKYLVGIMGLILVGSVIATGYLDTQRRKKENVPRGSEDAAPSLPLSPELQRGLKIYEEFSCAACHGPGGKGGVHNFNAQSGQEVPPLNHVADGFTKSELIAKIQIGVPIVPKLDPNGPAPPLQMPGFKDMLSDAQLDDLVAYLISLKPKGEESGF